MTTIGAFEAKGHFSEPLDRVEKGERIAITRPGKRLDGLPSPSRESNGVRCQGVSGQE